MKGFIQSGIFLFWTVFSFAQTSVYVQQVQTRSQTNLSLAAYANKKILIALCSAYAPDLTRLRTLDNLNKSNGSVLQVIVMPLTDIDSPAIRSAVTSSVLDTSKFSFVVCKAGNGKKLNSSSQIPFMAWLTNKNGNVHFDNDLQNGSQMFVVGENGILYAELFGAADLTNGNLTKVLSAKAPDK